MKRKFKTAVVLSITSRVLLCEFSEMHEAIEFAAGHPVWSHEMANRQMMDRIREQVYKQHPRLQDVEEAKGVNTENWREFVKVCVEMFGEELELEQGAVTRDKSPLETFKETFEDVRNQARKESLCP